MFILIVGQISILGEWIFCPNAREEPQNRNYLTKKYSLRAHFSSLLLLSVTTRKVKLTLLTTLIRITPTGWPLWTGFSIGQAGIISVTDLDAWVVSIMTTCMSLTHLEMCKKPKENPRKCWGLVSLTVMHPGKGSMTTCMEKKLRKISIHFLSPRKTSHSKFHKPTQTSHNKFTYSQETQGSLVSPFFINWKVLVKGLWGYAWFLQRPVLHRLNSSGQLIKACVSICLLLFLLFEFASYAE